MDDAISRQAAIDDLINLPCYTLIDEHGKSCGAGVRLKFAVAALNNLPAVDPVKHARWISDTGGSYCSNCKHHTDDDEIGNWDILFGKWVYCPHCGAKMDDE